MTLYHIVFFSACFGAGCIPAARQAAERRMNGMASIWRILSAAAFFFAIVLLVVAVLKDLL